MNDDKATDAPQQPEPLLGLGFSDQLGRNATERDTVLREMDDRTNQTWAAKRKRWAKLVRVQDAEIVRLHAALAAEQADKALWVRRADKTWHEKLFTDKIDRLREFLAIWIADGSLQTFEHREKFRAEAKALLGA